MYGVLLSGDHPTLPLAELDAVLAVHGGRQTRQLTSRVIGVDGEAGLDQMVHSLGWGPVWGDVTCDIPGIAAAAIQVAGRASGTGSAAVRSRRYGHEKTNLSQDVARTLGGALGAAGHKIDLRDPDMELFAWLGEERIVFGLQRGTMNADFEHRINERRAHFSPVGMHPRRAAGLTLLARVKPGGKIADPFCGTGGIALEAGLMGFDVYASDLDSTMVQGTAQTLTDVPPEPLDATVFQADIGEVSDMVDVDGIVTDMPYGGASSTHDEELESLYTRALDAFSKMLPVGGRAVVGHANPELLADAESFGFERCERHAEFVHRSLTRYYAVLQRI